VDTTLRICVLGVLRRKEKFDVENAIKIAFFRILLFVVAASVGSFILFSEELDRNIMANITRNNNQILVCPLCPNWEHLY